jgi:hypothetical protein
MPTLSFRASDGSEVTRAITVQTVGGEEVTPATWLTRVANAPAGAVLYMAAGNYGSPTITSNRAGRVTLTPSPGVARSAVVLASPVLSNARNITFDGVTFQTLELKGSTRDITVQNSRFSGMVVLRATTWNQNNVLLDRNEHIGVNVGFADGSIYLPTAGANPCGITVSNSLFDGGTADGILNGANGLQIINNEFRNKVESGEHTDPIQLYGSLNTVIRGNWIHSCQIASGIMAPDGTQNELIEHNVIDMTASGDKRALNIGGDVGSIIRHNTLIGYINIKADKNGVGSQVSVVRDNIATGGITVVSSSIGTRSHNLGSGLTGTSEINGQPTFVGGSGVAGYRLATGSLGRLNASDGTDRGAAV